MPKSRTKTIDGVEVTTRVFQNDDLFPGVDIPEGSTFGQFRIRTDWYDKANLGIFLNTASVEEAEKILDKIAMKEHRELVKKRGRAERRKGIQ